MKLLIATFNQGKLEDYRDFAKDPALELVSLQDLGITEEFEETHGTFEENAKTKAEFYQKLSGIPTLADDSGIEIFYYHMEPGVHTKRWGGFGGDGKAYREFVVEKIKAIPEGQRQAQLRAVLAYYNGQETVLEEGVIRGMLTDKVYPSVTNDYPWDPVFIIDELGKYYEELDAEENRKYNHRSLAFAKLKPKILS